MKELNHIPTRFKYWPCQTALLDIYPDLKVFTADTATRRFKGLMLLPDLPTGYGLLLPKTRSIHTAFMRFNIDLVWLDEDLDPIRIDHSVKPFRVRSCKSAFGVLEVKS